MNKIKILWADDEIDLLKPHIIFLEQKGYDVTPVISGNDAIEEVEKQDFNLIFLDEQMPGLSGLETLIQIKKKREEIPIVMVTKTEDEYLMDDAIGSQISDYLIKPVNPKQLWLTIKKFVDNKRLVSEKITTLFQLDFRELSMMINENLDAEGWKEIYKKIVYWDIELEKSNEASLVEIHANTKAEANKNFFRFIESNYPKWLKNTEEAPVLSNKLLYKKVLPHTLKNKPVFFILIDNFRYDQWKYIQTFFSDKFKLLEDDLFYSILPTVTNYSRNSIFSGLMPADIERNYPSKWVYDEEAGSKNKFEAEHLGNYLQRLRKKLKYEYVKVTSLDAGKKLAENISNYLNNDLTIIVYNFIDLLSHIRTEMEVIKELAEDEAAYRSLTKSWYSHSHLYEAINKISENDCTLILSTDHGAIRVKKPTKVIGDKNTTTNLRFKQGKNLDFYGKDVYQAKNPQDILLPRPNVSSTYIFAKEDYYFIYPNNYNHFVNFFNNTFQHGGISLEEMLVPVITMENK